MTKKIILLLAGAALFMVASAQSLYTLQTKNLTLIYYDKSYGYLVPHVARCFENGLRFHEKLFQWQPTEPVTVLLEDFGDFGNGAAGTIPHNLVDVGIAPFSYAYETLPANERMSWVMNHELAHVVSLDKSDKTDRMFRSIFSGKVSPIAENPLTMIYSYLTTPRTYSSRWYREGLAVFLETWMAGGLGRALGSYDEMMFRTMVRDSSEFYDPLGLESEGTKVDFQVGTNNYLYGTRFITYVAWKHGPEKLLQWIARTEDSKGLFGSEFKELYGISLDDEWDNWIRFEHEWQHANLDSIRKYPLTQSRTISTNTLGSISRVYYEPTRRVLYAALNYPGQVSHLAAINVDNGSVEKVCDVRGGAVFDVSSVAYDASTETLFFTTDNNEQRSLEAVNVATGETRTLMERARVGDLAFDKADKSLWGVRHQSGISTIVRIPYPYTEWNQVYSWPYGKDVYDIDVSPDGTTLTAALAEVTGQQRLIRMSTAKLLQGDESYEFLYDFENSNPANFSFSPDGKFLVGTSYYTGVSNVFRYDLQTRKMDVLSNCETGFFRPVSYSEDSLVVFRYSGKGFVPEMIRIHPIEDASAIRYLGNELVEKYPIVKTWVVGSPASIPLDSLTTYSGDYSVLRNFGMNSLYPIMEGYKEFAAYGARTNLSDKLLIHSVDVTASFTPNQDLPAGERVHASANYKFWGWRLSAAYNAADFYDRFGPTKTSRKGYSAGVEYRKTLLYNKPEVMDFTVRLFGYGGLERLPEYQNVFASYEQLVSLNARLAYQHLRKSLGATDEEKGIQWELIGHNNYVNSRNIPFISANVNYGVALSLNHSSLWLRTSLGKAFGDKEDPFANFFFGGFGNNWIDHKESKRFREDYSFPGTTLNSIGGGTYVKALLEWQLPPLRFRHFGTENFYCSWAQTSLFTSMVKTNLYDAPIERAPYNIGGQVDFKIFLFHSVETTFSFGYATAFEKSNNISNEVMVSLKVQ